ncbi:hypothetical protein [Roseisolibacter sp. H3M3-2]|uniref:hypothetical protein n=1 Tax=Roseisolibacter sp. H3M3-2 TaxID=3031323 RepID=UPI0023DB10FF|nr:hypothetical protein [Roseisolibacter sp. H3M3-2]MDF1505290.1 hypothetical protein [Roseisolibacter sp. H3M3-2]
MRILLIALLASTAWYGASRMRGASATRRALRELGHVAVPRRLADREPEERDGLALFAFGRVPGSPQYMGSTTPYAERLVVAAWTPTTRAEAADRALRTVALGVEGLTWEADAGGDAVAVGTGTYEANMARRPAWVLVRDDSARGLTFAYMAWRRDASREAALRTLERVAGSFAPALPTAEYLALARARGGVR